MDLQKLFIHDMETEFGLVYREDKSMNVSKLQEILVKPNKEDKKTPS
jgi:hypothetical protein